MAKIAKLKLSYPHRMMQPELRAKGDHWRVEQATDSTEYAPGAFLDKRTVDELCASKAWSVTIVPVKRG